MELSVKSKIGSHLSYPLKFSELQDLLAPVSAQRFLEVWYYSYKAPRQNEHREAYAVLEARYSPSKPEAKWMLYIRPVPRELRHSIHSLLPAMADQIGTWYLATHPPIWHTLGHALFVDYISAQQRLTIRTFN